MAAIHLLPEERAKRQPGRPTPQPLIFGRTAHWWAWEALRLAAAVAFCAAVIWRTTH